MEIFQGAMKDFIVNITNNQASVNKIIRSVDDLDIFQDARIKAAAEAPPVMASLADEGKLPKDKEITLLDLFRNSSLIVFDID